MALENIDSSLVTVGKPTTGGCVYTSFKKGAALPTSATTKMSTLADFESLGDVSENGFTETKSVTNNKHKNWNGDIVLADVTEETHSFKIEFIEPNRPTVAKLRFGVENVETGADDSVSHIKAVVGAGVEVPLVIDELESNGYLRRTVIPRATIDTFDDVPHQRGSLLVYGMTFTALKGEGNLYDIYRAKPATEGE